VDDRLRRIERDARARPDDLSAGRTLAQELARAGERVSTWREWCRLARQGELEAWDALERRPVALRARPSSVARRMLRPAAQPLVTDAFGRDTIAFAGETLSVVDPVTLATRWSAQVEGLGLAVACGPRVARIAPEAGDALIIHDALTGAELGRTRLGRNECVVERLESTADRIVVWARDHGVRGPGRVLTFDAGEKPAAGVASLRVREQTTPIAAMHGHLVCAEQAKDGLHVSARPVDGGPPRWSLPGSLLAADARGALLVSWPEGGRYDPEPSVLTEVDLATGARRWRREGEPVRAGAVRLAPGVVVQASRLDGNPMRPEDEVLQVRALDRTNGEVLWRYHSTGHHALLDVALTEGVAYVAVAGVAVGASGRLEVTDARLLGLDLASGQVLFAHALNVPMWWAPDGNRSKLSLVPVERGALVVASDKQTTTIERFE
jgi:hypothetical protein